ncbi:ammonium transporter [Sulfuriferula nivalis]|uniref:Ammonium transporter n=1 Tax=Sulfuriferula nivalis TaxID=2675298 RepID=A0A809SBV3_9PROT|nr:ammonium transporter [Sulfuriferula nivalis]BBO99456.1 ammonium transporter [Sulfuriferula nivalis]
MKKWLIALSMVCSFGIAGMSNADDTAAPAAAPAATVAAPDAAAPAAAPAPEAAAPAAAAPAAATPAPAAAPPVADKGDTTWMLVATALVIMMTIPGLALFYGGLVREKNMLSVLTQIFTIFCIISILWVVYGYSMAFSPGNEFVGGLSKAFLKGVDVNAMAETFSKGVYIPELVFMVFQLTFAAITVALIVGGLAERVKFSAMLIFGVLWFTFSYLPMAHMVWFWGGPSAFSDPSGFLFGKGALDFAGGTVVHINAGMAALMGAIVLGKRIGYGKEAMAPHSLVMTMIGASLLWVGWFGFNAGSNLEATGTAVLAMVNTIVATAAAGLSWMFVEWMIKGKPSMLGVTSGAVAGLVAVTPAAGFAGPMGAIVLGAVTGAVCLWSVTGLKHMLGYDDSLDVFGVHGIGGMIGAIGTGIVASPALGGSGVFDYAANKVADYDMSAQLVSQLWAVGTAVVWSGVVSFILFKLIDMFMGLRVPEEEEREGLDTTTHGERAYNM